MPLTQVFARMPLRSSLRAWSFLSSFQTFRGSSFAAQNCRRFAFVSGIKADRNDSMLINWDAKKETWSKYHYEWLRDNCNCPECYHPDTRQRLFRITEDTRPDSVQSDDERVEIKWKDGHSSQFVLSWLLENSYCHHNIDKVRPPTKKPAQTLWDAEYFSNRELPSVDYEEYMKSDEVLLKMLQKFRQHGLCFIHNTPVSEEAMGDALRRIAPLRKTYYGEVWTFVVGNMSINDLAYGTGVVDLHTDNCPLTEAPGILAFHCLEYSGEGGESKLLDGFCVAEHIRQMNPEYFSLLSKVSIPFEVDYPDGFFHARKTFFQTDHKGEVVKVNYNYWDRKPLDAQSVDEMQSVLGGDPDKAMITYYKALHCLHNLLYGDKFIYEIKLSPGMLLVFNNQRVIHGRREFSGHRKLCGGSINCEEWESTLRLMENANYKV